MAERDYRDWERAQREIEAIRRAPVNEAARTGPAMGDADWNAEKAWIKQEWAATEYIRANYQQHDRLAVVVINRETGRVTQHLRTAEEIVQPAYQSYLRGQNMIRGDVYVSANTIKPEATGRKKADIDEVRHLYLDMDAGGRPAVDRILRELPRPHHVLETSKDKHLVMWSVEGYTPAQAETTLRGLAREYKADHAAVDSARVVRVPGYMNQKYPERNWIQEVGPNAPDRIYTPRDFPRYEPERAREVVPWVPDRSRGEYRGRAPIEFHVVTPEQQARGLTQSDVDWASVRSMLAARQNPEVVRARLEEFREQYAPKPGIPRYAERTVSRAQEKGFEMERER